MTFFSSSGLRALIQNAWWKKKQHKRFLQMRLVIFFFYLQRLRACWEPGQGINVNAGDGARSPLGALALSGAGVNLRAGARTEDDEREQRARYHLHAEWVQRKNKSPKRSPKTDVYLCNPMLPLVCTTTPNV